MRTLSPRTRTDLRAAVNQVIHLDDPDIGETAWPHGLLQAALTRDGNAPVINDLSDLTAKTVVLISEITGESFPAVVDRCQAGMSPEVLPFSPVAWTRARTVTLYRLGEPSQIHGGPIEAVDLASALVLLHVLGTLVLYKAQQDAKRSKWAGISYRPHRTPKRRKKPRKR